MPPPITEAKPPLILTLLPDDALQARLDAERAAHFPKKINYLRAHVTLFHHLPGHRLAEAKALVKELAAQTSALQLRLAKPISLGRGVAYLVECPGAMTIHKTVKDYFAGELTAQDSQPRRLHVTIQNKVDPVEARALLAEVQKKFTPVDGQAVGLGLYKYLGGPWELVENYLFTKN